MEGPATDGARWVCLRCFASNEADVAACSNCGLARGAQPEADEVANPAWVAPEQPQGWRRWVRFWWVPAVVIFGIVAYLGSAQRDNEGQIVDDGTLQIADMRVGDCFDMTDATADEFSEVEARPCTQAHEFELFHVVNWTGSDAYPSDAAIDQFIGEKCLPAFDTYVGMAYQASTLEISSSFPTPESWDAGDRGFQCLIIDPLDDELTVSLENASR